MDTQFGTIKIDLERDAKMARVIVNDSREIQDVVSLIEKNDICVDAGAYIGFFSIAATRQGAKVSAFEPNAITRKTLRQNAKGKDIKVYAHGLGSDSYKASVHENPKNAANSYLKKGGDVSVVRLDDIVSKVDFLKIDVEGMEPDVLDGMGNLSPHSIYVEVFVDMLRKHGNTLQDIDCRLSDFKKYINFNGKWYQVPSILSVSLLLNPGRLVGRGSLVLNILATKKPFPAASFFKLICEKYF